MIPYSSAIRLTLIALLYNESMAIAVGLGLHVSSAGVWTKLKDWSVLNVWCDIEYTHDWSMRHNETVYLLFNILFKSERCFPDFAAFERPERRSNGRSFQLFLQGMLAIRMLPHI